MSTFSLRLPESLHEDLRGIAELEGVSINQFIAQAVAEKVAVLKQADRIGYYRNRPPVSRERFRAILEKAGNDEPPREGDEMTPDLERIAQKLKGKRP